MQFIDKRWQRIAFYAVLFTLIIGGLFGSVAATVVSYIWIAAGTSLTVQLQWSTCIAYVPFLGLSIATRGLTDVHAAVSGSGPRLWRTA